MTTALPGKGFSKRFCFSHNICFEILNFSSLFCQAVLKQKELELRMVKRELIEEKYLREEATSNLGEKVEAMVSKGESCTHTHTDIHKDRLTQNSECYMCAERPPEYVRL